MINLMFYCLLLYWWLHIVHSLLFILLGTVVLLSFLGYTLWRYILLAAPQSWVGLGAKESQQWLIISRSGKIYDALLRKDSQIFPGMIALRFNLPEHFYPITITLFKDSLMPDEWRRLRACLNWINKTSG